MLELTLIHVSKKGIDCIKIDSCYLYWAIWQSVFTAAREQLWEKENVVFPYSIHVIFELFEAFDLRATFMIW